MLVTPSIPFVLLGRLWAGRCHGSDAEGIGYQTVIKLSVDLWLKNGRKSTLMLEWCLIINALWFVAWRRPARRNSGDAYDCWMHVPA